VYHHTGRLGSQQCTLHEFATLILSEGNGAMCWWAVLPPFWKNLLSRYSFTWRQQPWGIFSLCPNTPNPCTLHLF